MDVVFEFEMLEFTLKDIKIRKVCRIVLIIFLLRLFLKVTITHVTVGEKKKLYCRERKIIYLKF